MHTIAHLLQLIYLNEGNCIRGTSKNYKPMSIKHKSPEIGYSIEISIFGYEYDRE